MSKAPRIEPSITVNTRLKGLAHTSQDACNLEYRKAETPPKNENGNDHMMGGYKYKAYKKVMAGQRQTEIGVTQINLVDNGNRV